MKKYLPLAGILFLIFLFSSGEKVAQLSGYAANLKSAFSDLSDALEIGSPSQKEDMQNTSAPPSFFDEKHEEETDKSSGGNYILNPIVKSMLESESLGVDESAGKGLAGLERIDGAAGKWLFIAAAGILIFMFLTCKTNLSWMGFSLARTGFALGGLGVFTAVAVIPLGWFFGGYNCLENLGGLLVQGPTAIFVSSAASLKIYDFNQPVWNTLIIGCAALALAIVSLQAF